MSCCGSCGGEDVNQTKEQEKAENENQSQVNDKEVEKTEDQE